MPRGQKADTAKGASAKVGADVRFALEAIKAAAIQAYHNHKSLFDDTADAKQRAPELTLVSALADGADTIAAKAALDLGYTLDAPLPSSSPTTPRISTRPRSTRIRRTPHDEFARACRESPRRSGITRRNAAATARQRRASQENRAYEAAGLTVISQADIVLAIWDIELSRGRGGTAEIVAEAARAGMPIILVDATARGRSSCAGGGSSSRRRGRGLRRSDRARPRRLHQSRSSMKWCARRGRRSSAKASPAWYKETAHRINPVDKLSRLLMRLSVRPPHAARICFRGRPDELADDYVKDAKARRQIRSALEQIRCVADPYGWADAVGVYCSAAFSQRFRHQLFLRCFRRDRGGDGERDDDGRALVLAARAGRDRAGSHSLRGRQHGFFGRRWRWHHRWVEAREVAEQFGVALPLWTLGLRPASFPGEEPTWTGWYIRALVRMQGLRAAFWSRRACCRTRRAADLAHQPMRLQPLQCRANVQS